jgi:hypothetical protein
MEAHAGVPEAHADTLEDVSKALQSCNKDEWNMKMTATRAVS